MSTLEERSTIPEQGQPDQRRSTPTDLQPLPRPQTDAELRFTPARPVRWLSPKELSRAAMKVVLSGVFGEYADKRELLGTFPAEIYDFSRRDGVALNELWWDYVSDLGDGFNATYTVASLLGSDELVIDGARLPRGDFLVMGGDEVYPVASVHAYEQRTSRPYRAALPVRGRASPALLAIPGNHDWYDGLTSFLRVFTQSWLGPQEDPPPVGAGTDLRVVDPAARCRDWVGGWRTQQSRSYFAARLPHDWWLLAVDVQFDTYIDAPQRDYFHQVAHLLGPESNVVVCTAKPSWADSTPGCYETLDWFAGTVISPTDANVHVMLAGDTHHYARYEEEAADTGRARQLVTCGGGGAYLSATHGLPESIQVPPVDPVRTWHGPASASFAQRTTWPGVATSRAIARGWWRIPLRNPSFTLMLGAVQALLVWALAAATGERGGLLTLDAPAAALAPLRLPALLLTALVLCGAVAFAKASGWRRWVAGGAHGVTQVALAVGLALAASAVPGLGSWPSWAAASAVTVAVVAVGGLASSALASLYLFLASLRRLHLNDLFAGLRVEDQKCFLRLHVSAEGLTIHPIGVERVARRWRLQPQGPAGSPWLVPAPGEPEVAACRIEPPITVRPAPRPTDPGPPSGGGLA